MGREAVYPRTAAELLNSITNIRKNIEQQKDTLTKVENELNNTISTLIINLSSVLGNQSEISLWFFDDIPTKENKPYTDWKVVSEHDGDIYYDKTSGYVYQFLNDKWERNEDYNLVQAMALTNAELNQEENERKVFFNVPVVPYKNGDWWIKSDGTLFVCQISREIGDFIETDFISSAKYSATIAVAQGNEIKVLKGTVTQISENYVSVEDLATGGKTVIAGENIKTGSIVSANYEADKQGMLIDLNQGTIDTKNCKIDKFGNILLHNGSKVISDNGILSCFQFVSSNDGVFLGFYVAFEQYKKSRLILDVYIPQNFLVEQAKLILTHNPIYWNYEENNTTKYFWGWSRNIRLYKVTNLNQATEATAFGGELYNSFNSNLSEIVNAFGTNGFTAATPSNTNCKAEIKESIDLKNHITAGRNIFVIQTANNTPNAGTILAPNYDGYKQTGNASAILNVLGYMN